jgi:hypothetical protein
MDTSDDTTPRGARADRPIPFAGALAVMALVLFAGAALIAKYLYPPAAAPPPPLRTVVPSPSNPRVAGGPPAAADDSARAHVILAAAAEPELPDGVHPSAGGVTFKAGDAYLKFADDPQPARAAFGYFTLSDDEWLHGYLTQGVRRLTLHDDYARELAVTDDQRKRLADLPAPPPSRWPDADRDHFLTLYREWRLAPDDARPAAQATLLKALAEYATTQRTANRKRMADRVAAIRSILDDRQLARINPIPRWELPAATRPTTSPATGRIPPR